MSKKKRKIPFDAPPRTVEKYRESLAKSESAETLEPSVDDKISSDSGATDATLQDDYIFDQFAQRRMSSKAWGVLKIIGGIIGVVAGIIAIVVLIFSISTYFSELKNSINSVTSGVNRIEADVKDFSKEFRTRQEDMRLSLAQVFEKIYGLFNNLSRTQTHPAEKVFIEEKKQ